MATRIFISYSHKDADALERLHTHLAVLRRDKLIDQWYDRDILAGGRFDKEIIAALDSATIFLALVSPDFLASNYCVEKEMARAIEREKQGDLRIVSVILEPCEWRQTALSKFKVTPRDGKPVSDWVNANTAYLDVATEIRRIVEEDKERSRRQESPASTGKTRSSRQYRIKRDFDEVDKVEFRESSFEIMCSYFADATAEINLVDAVKARFSRTGDSFSASIINRGLQRGVAHLTVHRGGGRSYMGEIYYSWQENAERNTSNGSFEMESDGYELFWKPNDFKTSEDDAQLTAKQAAESLWNAFLEKAGIHNA